MNWTRFAARRLVLLCCLALILLPVAAQFTARVQGVVNDAAGATVPGAKIVLTAKANGRRIAVATNQEGVYRIGSLAPGQYSISVEATGFQGVVMENLLIKAEDAEGVNFTLHPAALTQTMTVTAEAERPLQTENADVARSISNEEVARLPQTGRDPFELVRLAPGVFGDGARGGNGNAVGLPNSTGPGGSNSSIFQTENQVQVTANGQRLSANNFTVDGVSVNSLGWGGAAVLTPNQESVEEIRVLSTSYSAADGRNSGAQVKVVSKSGGNAFHGSGFFKYQDPSLNAYNRYGGPNAPPVKVMNRYRQMGGSLGGPILRDKLFFFFSWEGLRTNQVNYSNTYIETPQFRDLIQRARPGGVTARVFSAPGIAPGVSSILPADCAVYGNDSSKCRVVAGGLDLGSPAGALGAYVPAANPIGGGFDGVPDVQYAQLALPRSTRGDQYNTRADYNRGKDHFALSGYLTPRYDYGSDSGGRARPMGRLKNRPLHSAATALWNRVLSPSSMNEARMNMTRWGWNQVDTNPNVNWGIPRLEVEALPFDRIRWGANRASTTPAMFAQTTYGFADTFSRVVSRHALKLGAEMHREQNNDNQIGAARPIYSFTGMWNLANDTPISEQISADPRTGAPTDNQRYFRSADYSLFFQDDWKLRRNLTVNLGLRWEYFGPLSEKEGRLSKLAWGSGGLLDSHVVQVERLYLRDLNNFGPRLGMAWNPSWLGQKLVVRGGAGVFYNRVPAHPFDSARGNPPYGARFNLCCASDKDPFAKGAILYTLGQNNSVTGYPINPALAKGIDPKTGAPAGLLSEIWTVEDHLPAPYIFSYSFDIEYQMTRRWVATLGYQGSASHKLLRTVNQNFLYTPSPAFSAVYLPTPDVNANFNALNTRLSREFAGGLHVNAMYRWAKSIDASSSDYGGGANQTYPIDLRSERGPSDYDVTHNLVVSSLWDVPVFRKRRDWLGTVFGGWQLNGILSAHSGFPWTPTTGQPLSDLTKISPSRPTALLRQPLGGGSNQDFMRPGGNFPGGGRLYFDIVTKGRPGIGRNSFRGPHYFMTDVSLMKTAPLPRAAHLGERARLELRANFFNLFNKLNLTPFTFNSASTKIENDQMFGRAAGGLAGRVVELQARISF